MPGMFMAGDKLPGLSIAAGHTAVLQNCQM